MGHAARRRRLLFAGALTLALVTIAIGAVVWHDGRESERLVGPVRAPLAIVIERAGFADIGLSRLALDADWRIDAPCALAVNAQRLTPLLEALNAVSARYSADAVDLDGAGLTASDTAIRLDGVRHVVGGPDLSGERRYLRHGDTVELVPEWILSLVRGGLTAFAMPDVLPPGSRVTDDAGVDPSELAALEAVQIIEWPPLEPATIEARATLPIALADGAADTLALLRTERYLAVVRDGAGCAHLLPPDALATVFEQATAD